MRKNRKKELARLIAEQQLDDENELHIRNVGMFKKEKKMRATEYLHSVKHGIQEKELYSHLDIQDKKLRRKIAKDRRKVRQYVYPEQKEF